MIAAETVQEWLGKVAGTGWGAFRTALGKAEKLAGRGLPPEAAKRVAGVLRTLGTIDAATLEGYRYVAQATLSMYQEALAKRRRGEYRVDEFGLDEDFVDLVRPLFTFLYAKWWRVEVLGLENLPQGRALLVSNHSGVLPWDGAMISYGIWEGHPEHPVVRFLYLDWFNSLPFVAPILARVGGALACPENAERLLSRDRTVVVFPEGLKGVGKLYRDRYRLARFGRGGFVKVALRAKAPIVPISVVGAEEIYPNLMRVDWVGKLLGAPYFVLTPTFPWLGLLGLVPLPSKWYIQASRPIPTGELGPEAARDFLAVSRLTERVRADVHRGIQRLLVRRKAAFF